MIAQNEHCGDEHGAYGTSAGAARDERRGEALARDAYAVRAQDEHAYARDDHDGTTRTPAL